MLSFQKTLNSAVNVAQDRLDHSMLQSVDLSRCIGQSLFVEYFAVLLGANDMGEQT